MKGMATTYFMSARQTGRTVSLVESVKDGDRIVFIESRDAERVKRMCKERGVEVECIVVDPQTPARIFERATSQGRTIFDHRWVEQYYMAAIDNCQRNIDHLERQSSGFGEAHRETRRKAEEISRWRI